MINKLMIKNEPVVAIDFLIFATIDVVVIDNRQSCPVRHDIGLSD